MNRAAADVAPDSNATPGQRPARRGRVELILASIWLAIGLFVLPAVIFGVGTALLGAYGDGKGLGSFYGDFFADLAEPSARTWTIALGPLVLISLLRVVFLGGAPKGTSNDEDSAENRREITRQAPKTGTPPSRIEPRVSAD